jgi:hypothetical protein
MHCINGEGVKPEMSRVAYYRPNFEQSYKLSNTVQIRHPQ